MTNEIGIHEKVDLLGQSFDIQTELVDLDTETVRTVIFHRGEVAAHREGRLRALSESGGDDLEERLREHHRKALERFVKRTLGFEARAAGAEIERDALPAASVGKGEEAPELPPIPEDPALADTIEVRRLVGKLLARLDLAPLVSENEAEQRDGWRGWIGHLGRRLAGGTRSWTSASKLEEARQALSWTVAQPRFQRVRMDEQVLFRLLRERIDDWYSGDRDAEEAKRLWTEVVALCDYLREINLRSDLLEFDRILLNWAIAELDRAGSSRSVHRPLQWILGRDHRLDTLLEADETADAVSLRAEIERVRASI
jgi:hypothetical protein